jgi:hypothetical protein
MHRNLSLPILLCLVLSASAALAVNVTVSSPSNNYVGTSPLRVAANASSDQSISGWVVYVDGQVAYQAGWTSKIDANINVGEGTHELVVRAWDARGRYGHQYQQITIGGGGDGLPVPPDWAKVFSNVHRSNSWGSCHDPGCAGGSGKGTYWMAKNQGEPSLSGASTQFYNSGVWANALWWTKLGPYNSARNFLMDYYLYVDDASQKSAQALEMEAFQFVDGYNYMMGMQCSVGSKVWDTWDEISGKWMHTNVYCGGFSPKSWHHIQWYITTDTNAHNYTYKTLVVDGQPYTLNITRRARHNGWNNNVGVQWQLDVNATGAGYNEWVDKAKLTIW